MRKKSIQELPVPTVHVAGKFPPPEDSRSGSKQLRIEQHNKYRNPRPVGRRTRVVQECLDSSISMELIAKVSPPSTVQHFRRPARKTAVHSESVFSACAPDNPQEEALEVEALRLEAP